MLSCRKTSITGTLPKLRGALLFPAQMLGGIVVSSGTCSPIQILVPHLGLSYHMSLLTPRSHAD